MAKSCPTAMCSKFGLKATNCLRREIVQEILESVKKLSQSKTFNSCYCKLVHLKQFCIDPITLDQDLLDRYPQLLGQRRKLRELDKHEILTNHLVKVIKQLPLLNSISTYLLMQILSHKFLGLLIILSSMFYDRMSDNIILTIRSNLKRNTRRDFFKNLDDFMTFMINSWMQKRENLEKIQDEALLTPDMMTNMHRCFISSLHSTFKHMHVEAALAMAGVYLLSSLDPSQFDPKTFQSLQSHRLVYTDLLNYLVFQSDNKRAPADFVLEQGKAWLLFGDVRYMDLCHAHVARAMSKQPIVID